MTKFRVGDKVIAVGDCVRTGNTCGLLPEMRMLIETKCIMKITHIQKEWIHANGWNWDSADLQLVNQTLENI